MSSTTIDERVVEMRFDNKQFESGVQTSLRTLENLKSGLNLSDAARGLSNLSDAAKNFTLGGLSNGIETVHAKFSALEVMAVTALANITNSAVNAGKRMANALTLQPITTGFKEYETQINAVQTILANTESKGTTLDDVNTALDELNKYADKTIYNFTEMTRNIGTFTAAGVDLDTSVTAIQGIANLAAVSGSNSEQASRAMYQLSQALSSGTVKLMDWNSVVNAGMGGQVFQDALKETARVHGIAIDKMIEDEGSFRETLSKEWLTADILTETLQKFTMSTEGLTEAQIEANREMLKSQGYSKAQIEAIFKLGNTATDAATKVKTFTQLWDVLKEAAQSGWTQSWETIVGDFEEAKALLTDISNIFTDLINKSSDKRNNLLVGWKDAGGREMIIESARNAFEALGSVITPIKEAMKEIFPPTTSAQLVAITKGLKEFTAGLKLSETQADYLKRTFKGLFAIIDIAKQAFSAVWKTIKPLAGGLGDLATSALEVTANWGDWLVNLSNDIREADYFGKALQGMVDGLKEFIDTMKDFVSIDDIMVSFYEGGGGIAGVFEVLFDRIVILVRAFIGLAESITGLDFSKFEDTIITSIQNVRNKVVGWLSDIDFNITGLRDTVFSAFGEMGEFLFNCKFVDAFMKIWEVVQTVGRGIISILNTITGGMIDKLKNVDFSNLFDVAGSASFAAVGVMLAKFFKDVLGSAKEIGSNVTEVLNSVKGCFEAYQNDLNANVLLKIAGAIVLLSASILLLSTIDGTQLVTSLAGIAGLFAELIGSMALLNTMGSGIKGAASIQALSIAMVTLSVAVAIMALALRSIAEFDPEEITAGVLGIATLMAALDKEVAKMAARTDTVIKGATSMVVFTLAVKVLASACADLGELDPDQMVKGLAGVSALMTAMGVFVTKSKFQEGAFSTAVGMIAMGVALNAMASACAKFGEMSLPQLGQGLLGMVAALTAMGAALHVFPKDILGMCAGLVLFGLALNLIGTSLLIMGGMESTKIAQALMILGVALMEIGIALNMMNGTLAGSAALLVAATALLVLTPALLLLGAMSVKGIVKSMVTIAGAFTILGVAGMLLAPLAPVILTLAGSFALIGLGIVGIGAGLLAIGAGITSIAIGFGMLATMGVAGATAVVSALSVIILGLVSLIPAMATAMAQGIIEFVVTLAKGATSIAESIVQLLMTIGNAIIECVPMLVEVVATLLTALIDTLVTYTPIIVAAVFNILLSCLQEISNNISLVVQTAVDIVVGFIRGIAKKIPDVVQVAFELIISFINGLADAIRNNTGLLVDAIWNLFSAVISAAVDVLFGSVSGFIKCGGDIIGGLLKGIGNGIGSIIDAAKNIGKSLLDGIKGTLGIASPSKEFAKVGMYSDEGLVQGLKQYSGIVNDAAEDVGSGALDSMSLAMSGVADTLSSDVDYEPTIRPIVDLSNVQSGASQLNGLLNQRHVASISSNYSLGSQSADPTEDIINRVTSKLGGQLLSAMNNSSTPVNLNVTLSGDAAKIFKVVKNENDRYIKTAGFNPLSP